MAKKSKKSSNAGDIYNIKIQGPGFVTLEGDIVSQSESAIVFRHRRPSSSKYQLRTIPLDKIAMMSAEGKGGSQRKLIYHSDTAMALRLRNATIEGADKNNPRFMLASDENGIQFLVAPQFLDAVTISDIDAPSDAKKSKKKKK